MSDYSQITFFTPKDSLSTGNPNKIIYGSDVDAEFSAISTAIATKADVDGDAIGAGTPATEINVDNLKLDGNKITSTDTDGDIELEPNGTGTVVITNVDVAAGEIDGTAIGANSASTGAFTTLTASGDVNFDSGTFFVDASANAVGIGTTSPSNTANYATLELSGATGSIVNLTDDGVRVGSFFNTVNDVTVGNFTATGFLGFRTNATERARIDSSGNLLVGRTSVGTGGTGHSIRGGDSAVFARENGEVMIVSRNSSNGEIVRFDGNGTAGVGSIGSYVTGPSIFIGSGNTGVLFADASDSVHPWNPATNSGNDNVLDLGALTQRWDDVYATNGTIQTSDANEKQDIAELDEAERRVAVAAKGLLRKFRWKSAVAEKGDDARIHFGIIAQDLQAAFEAEGLDAGRYAMFIHSTWTDEETGEERSRMGVRYSELLAFIIAAL